MKTVFPAKKTCAIILTVFTLLALTFGAWGVMPARAAGASNVTFALSNAPTLGVYPAASVALSGNVTVTPDAAPIDTTGINVSTSTDFKGTFAANPLTGVVTVTDAHPAGTYTVTVTAFGAGGTTSSTFTLTVAIGTACAGCVFTNASDVSVGALPRSVAIGDFNHDGNQDLATANWSANTVSIRLGDGSGGFSGTTDVSVGAGPYSVAIGDFNHDGNQDLATANSSAGTVSIRLGNGSGGFSGGTEVSVSVGGTPNSVAIGDFNHDGNQDLATANGGADTVSIRLGDGSGGFSGTTEVSVGDYSQSVAIGDFNHDGNQDLATANSNAGTVSIRLGDGSGGFSGTTEVSVGAYAHPFKVAIGDFNHDGNQDLATANASATGTVSIRLGNGSGGFSGGTDVSVGDSPLSVAIGDFNHDGNQDLATTNAGANTASIRLGDGSGGFSGTTDVSVGATPRSVAIGDFNHDGNQDLATANSEANTVSIRLGGCVYAVTYNGNGNTGGAVPTDSSSPYNYNSTVTVLDNTGSLVKTGYTFSGWNTAADGSGTSYSAGNTFAIAANTTLYAKWVLVTVTDTFYSSGTYDGWVLESGEKTSKGGSLDSKATTFRLGDDKAKKQYRGILSFSTKGLPDTATITKVTLKVRKQAIVGGGNPVTTFKGFMADIKKGYFGTSALQTADFQTTTGSKTYGPFKTVISGVWYNIDLTGGKAYINKASTSSGLTQIRLRFYLDDNNNTTANYLSLYSGNTSTVANRPQLVIEYYIVP